MSLIVWIALAIAVIGTFYPLVSGKELTKDQRTAVFRNAFILVAVVVAVFIFKMNPFIVMFGAIIAGLILDKKTYTKKRLLSYGGIVVALTAVFIFIFRSNPSYITKHLLDHPDTTSMVVAIDGEKVISHQEDVVRPLASVVKIAVALEYAYQVADGTIDEHEEIPMEDLDVYYIENTDGGAHPDWKEQQDLKDATTVTLKEAALGMIMYSSNANTEYLMDVLGTKNIDERMKKEGISPHEPIYPIVSSLLVVVEEKRDSSSKDWQEDLEKMDEEAFIEKSFAIHDQLKAGNFDTTGVDELSINEQRIWSDRLPGSSAHAYADLLRKIVARDFDEDVNDIMHELLRAGTESNPENKELYNAVGAKGGSTAFILNQAMFVETDRKSVV